MENKVLHRGFLFLTLATLAFVTVYSLIINYKFPEPLLNYFFSLFYLILSLNFMGNIADSSDSKERLKQLFKSSKNIFLYCLVSACFSIIFIHSGITVLKTSTIVLTSFGVYLFLMFVFNRKITQFLFWVNFYLFMGSLILGQLSNINFDLISKYNPLGGLFVTLFI
jgi:hypothetical protein